MTIVQRFFTDTLVVKRPKSGKYVKGRYVPGPLEEVTIRGSRQPTNARELKLPEEGNRLRQYWKFYTDAPLTTGNTRSVSPPDQVTINGESYRVMSVEAWNNFDLEYFKSILYRDPDQ